MIPLFDSLAHPTLSGNWPKHPASCSFPQLVRSLDDAGYIGACAVGMPRLEGYEHASFIAACRPYPQLIPIAGYDPNAETSANGLSELRDLGFVGIKIHPRFSKITRNLRQLADVFRAAGACGLVVFYCTYMHGTIGSYPKRDPFYDLIDLLDDAPKTKVVLVHGGDVSLLRYAELVRFNEQLLLDLSLTLMKYAGSSIDSDLRFLFSRFDQRICIGTDFPEYSPAEVRARFGHLAGDLPEGKQINIGHANLLNFLGHRR